MKRVFHCLLTALICMSYQIAVADAFEQHTGTPFANEEFAGRFYSEHAQLALGLQTDHNDARALENGAKDLLQIVSRPATFNKIAPSDAVFYTVNAAAFDDFGQQGAAIFEDFVYAEGRTATLLLKRFEALSNEAVIVAGSREGDVPAQVDTHILYTGILEGMPGSFVYLAAFQRYATGYLEIPAGGGLPPIRYVIAPISIVDGEPSTMIMYREAEVATDDFDDWTCAAEELEDYTEDIGSLPAQKRTTQRSALQSSTQLATYIAVDCDYTYYTDHSSNLSRCVNYAIAVMGAASAIYQRDVNVILQMPYLRVWTISNDPYSGNSSSALMNELVSHWVSTQSSIERSLVHLFSGVNGIGGIGRIAGLCSKNAGYAVSGLRNNSTYPTTSYTWDADVTSHELGHNFGSRHTHSCTWTPPIDSCSAAEGGCFVGITPRNGTVMSYCHLTSLGKSLYFHPQVASFVRDRAESANCLFEPQGQFEHDLAATFIVVPAGGGVAVNGESFTPTAVFKNVGTTRKTNVTVIFSIENADGNEVYRRDSKISLLDIGASVTVEFSALSLDEDGVYAASAEIVLNNDENDDNNILTRPFEVNDNAPGSITVVAPNSGGVFAVGEEIEIAWEHANIARVHIEFSPDGGATWLPANTNVRASNGSVLWPAPAIVTDLGLIRVRDRVNAAVFDESDRPFAIVLAADIQPLEFLTPVASEFEEAPFTPRVEFVNNGSVDQTNVRATLRIVELDGQSQIYMEETNIPLIRSGETAIAEFAEFFSLFEGDHVIIARSFLQGDQNPTNDSLGRAFVLTVPPPLDLERPKGGEEWCVGSVEEITWTARNINTVKIELSTDGGATFPVTLAESVAASAERWEWNIPSDLVTGDRYRVRITDVEHNEIVSETEGSFVLAGFNGISEQPETREACSGDLVILRITAEGAGLRYQWRKNGVDLPDFQTAVLFLSSVDLEDAGEYDVIVYSECTEPVNSAKATLTVIPSATIAKEPLSATRKVGEEARFSVIAEQEFAEFQWFKDGTPLAGRNAAELLIDAVAEEDAGEYSCLITGGCEPLESRTAHLTIARNAETQPYRLDFGETVIGQRTSREFVIVNIGPDELTVESVAAGGTDARNFEVLVDESQIDPQDRRTFTLEFAPSREGMHYAELRIAFSGDEPGHYVRLQGIGKLPTSVSDQSAGSMELMAIPNPSTGVTTIRVNILHIERMDMAVYDILGNKVRSMGVMPVAEGPLSVVWDGLDDYRVPCPSGTYRIVLSTSSGVATESIVIAR